MEFISDNALELTGYSPDDLENNKTISYSQLIHPDDRELVWTQTQDAISLRSHFNLEYRILTRSGQCKHVLEQGRGIFGPDGKLLALEGVILDDTSRKQAENNLRQVNHVLMAIRDINRLIVWEKKPEKLMNRACQSLVKYRGYSLAWIGIIEEGAPYVTPVASAGSQAGLLESARFCTLTAHNCPCKVCSKIMNGKIFITRNLYKEELSLPWVEEARKRGDSRRRFHSSENQGKDTWFSERFF